MPIPLGVVAAVCAAVLIYNVWRPGASSPPPPPPPPRPSSWSWAPGPSAASLEEEQDYRRRLEAATIRREERRIARIRQETKRQQEQAQLEAIKRQVSLISYSSA